MNKGADDVPNTVRIANTATTTEGVTSAGGNGLDVQNGPYAGAGPFLALSSALSSPGSLRRHHREPGTASPYVRNVSRSRSPLPSQHRRDRC